jgi:preprotein translocase subunit SecA
MLSKFVNLVGGDPNKKQIEKIYPIVDQINALEGQFEALSDDDLRSKTGEFRSRLEQGETLDDLIPEAFAAVREASKRTIGLRHYDVQMIGGVVLHRSTISEMRTGEGKTLVATLPLYLNALTGKGAHLITVNDYLARRDARWMGPIFHALGLSVGILQMAASTENGKKAYLYDPERESSQEDRNLLRLVDRRLAYEADITYGTNSEFGFDYLRDNMTYSLDDRVQRGHYFAIVDEVDNVLIDEARTPLIISGPASGDLEWYGKMAQVVRALKPEDYEVNEKERAVSLTELGIAHVEQLLGAPLRDPDRPEDVTPEQARMMGYLEQALRAQLTFKRNKDYLVQAGKVVIVDEFTGRLMPGRRWSDGLHQAVEAKEGVKVEPENVTYATITLQNYFRMYTKLAGMTGTALTEAEEFFKIYKLEVLPIPTNLEYQAARLDSLLIEVSAKDEFGYKYNYFANRDDTEKAPLYYRRKDYPDLVYRTVEAKLRAIVLEILRNHVLGRPMLVGTTSVESSDHLSQRLRAEPVRRLAQILLIRRSWMQQNDREEDGRLISELLPLNEPLEKLDVGTLRQQYGKPLNLSLNPEDDSNVGTMLEILNLDQEHAPRLKAALQGGISHQVLNARRHTEESQIIAGAGAFGAVTIATNMAGRGVDIKLGGDIAEEVVSSVNRVLRKGGYSDPYDMTLEERRKALQELDPSLFGIYEIEVNYFLQYFNDMEKVKTLGGLHVIGSERHEARRIDNQLRGRAARQGDPGSSRFYLSLEDDLMRLFSGQQVGSLMQRLQVDDSLPLENRIVGNLIESSQHRVEGANFDVRKHLLEYDDVLNAQRKRIYEQRDRVFTKEDLHEDVTELLRAEIQERVPESLKDPEGPWKLLAWLDKMQPPFGIQNGIFPSFTFRLLLDELSESRAQPREILLDQVRNAIETEQAHFLSTLEQQIESAGLSLENQLQERFDSLDTFLEGLSDSEETATRRPQELQEELQSVIRLPVRLSADQLRDLRDNPRDLDEPVKAQIETVLTNLAVARLAGGIELRLGEPLDVNKDQLMREEWKLAAEHILEATTRGLEKRFNRLVGENGQIVRDLDALLARENVSDADTSGMVRLLGTLSQGVRTAFDSKTHRQVQQVYQRFSYVFHAAHLLEDRNPAELTDDVLDHLEEAQEVLRKSFGQAEFIRLSQNASAVAELGIGNFLPASISSTAPLAELTDVQREDIESAVGTRTMTELYRRILLGAITELWVDYLTRIESLRVSIGLEAYGQRDPLVQYKSKASEMFQELLRDIRTAVISRMFSYQPRQFSLSQVQPVAAEPETVQNEAQPSVQDDASAKKKRKRH